MKNTFDPFFKTNVSARPSERGSKVAIFSYLSLYTHTSENHHCHWLAEIVIRLTLTSLTTRIDIIDIIRNTKSLQKYRYQESIRFKVSL